MKDFDTDVERRVNGNRSNPPPPSDFIVYPNSAEDYELRRRNNGTSANNVVPKTENVTCDRVKTNLIYCLIMIIVILVGVLSYTLLLIFEEKSDVLEPVINDVPNDLPTEQRRWYDNAYQELRNSLIFKANKAKAKNVSRHQYQIEMQLTPMINRYCFFFSIGHFIYGRRNGVRIGFIYTLLDFQ